MNLLTDPGVGGVLITGREVTEERRAALVGSFETHLLDTLPSAIVVTDDDGIVHYWNARASELFGYPVDEALGQVITDLAMAAPADKRDRVMEHVERHGGWEGEYVTNHKDGSFVPVLVTLERIDVPEIGFRGVLGTVLDNSERRSLQLTLADQAMHDHLTGLPNRALFIDRLDHALARLRRTPGTLAVLFLDLDPFKLVNDSCGHQAGDEVLREVAARFTAVLRPGDTVARLGGDEFAVCCEGIDGPVEALTVAEAARSCSTGACGSVRSAGPTWRASCVTRWTGASSSSTTSRRSA